MSGVAPSGSARSAAALRQAFDAGFAEPPPGRVAPADPLLAIRVRGEAYALRLWELRGLFKDKRVIPLPSSLPGLVGIAGFRGRVVPVADLGLLLGYGPSQDIPRWLALAGGDEPLGLAFEAFEHQFTAEDLAQSGAGPAQPYVAQALRVSGLVRLVVDVPALLAAFTSGAPHGPARSTGE